MAQKKFQYGNFNCDDVTNYSDTCAKLCKKMQKWTISKIEIVRVRKKIFYFSFQFLKAKRS